MIPDRGRRPPLASEQNTNVVKPSENGAERDVKSGGHVCEQQAQFHERVPASGGSEAELETACSRSF